MIPTHHLNETKQKEIIVNPLTLLNEYDHTSPHRHDYFEFFYFKNGGGKHKIDFIDFDIHTNSVHIVAPGQVHQMMRELDSEGFVMLFELNSLKAPSIIEDFLFEHICLDAGELNPTYKLSAESKSSNISRMESITNYYKNGKLLDKLSISNEAQAFCIECMKLKGGQLSSSNSEYFKFRKILKDHFGEIKKVNEYAKMMNVSEKSLNVLVKKQTGKSASDIIYDQITMEAKRLLNTGISVKETAFALNFDDPAHFSKFFKTQTGISPSLYQNNT